MSYVKYREDDLKISTDRLFMRDGSKISRKISKIQYFECKHCHQLFTSKPLLIRHIREVHYIVRPIIIINDRVIGDHTVLQYVDHAKVLMYGFEGDIIVGSHVVKNDNSDELDITTILKAELTKNQHCDIIADNACISVDFHPLVLDDNSSIRLIVEEWQNSASHGLLIDPSKMADYSGGDLLFLQGIYNYYLACSASHYKSKRYDDAFAALSQFNDIGGIGKCVLKAIAFRRNWVETLRLLTEGEKDVFFTACDYYQWKKSSFEYEHNVDVRELYVEDGTRLSLELIVLFQKGLLKEAKAKLDEFGDIDMLNDLNLAEQLYYLKARIALAEGDKYHAKRYFDRLITPAFCADYQHFL